MKSKIVLSVLILFLSLPLFANSAVIFMYHRFGETTHPSTNITIEQFQYQLDYLEENDYNVWPLSKIISYLKNGQTLPKKTIALTIDDAYISTYTKAFPMLKDKKFPFSVFVSTNPIDNKSKFYMSWEQMMEMQQYGAQFANHSVGHDFLLPKNSETDEAWEKRINYQIKEAQIRLQEEFGADTNENPRLFSYPFGEYNIKTTELLKELGYIGITQTSGPIGENSDFRALSRFPMAEAFANSFVIKLNTLPMPIKSVFPIKPIVKEKQHPKLRISLSRALKNLKCYISSGEEIKVKWISSTEIEVIANAPLKPPRQKYTCTAPAENGKWYWYSHLWIVK